MSEHPLSDPQLEVTTETVKQRFDAGEVQVIDVREQYEWDAGRIPGDVRHIELQHLSSQAATIDKDKPVVFQCRLGSRSLMAAQAFRAAGYEAYSLTGGLQAWHDAGLPLDPPDGTVADH
jgi:rhodanese-related sulfurtransferase